MLTKDEVLHIAKLAKIKITDQESEKFSQELSNILDFFGQLQEVNTENVPETSQVTGLENVWRKDEIKNADNIQDCLECTPHEVENNCIKIPKIM
jgi:aspartyl-tRNA(Asn)/glutamyl-tRNA(Gln) amidotransferase subunit C